jgi:6,7-dimethyl-8-ribityllumazine synthase
MLTKVSASAASARGFSFAIVASRYNARYVDAMLRAARQELQAAGASRLRVVRVPGAYEIPLAVAALARSEAARPEAIICLGVILRGETVHAAHIGENVSRVLMDLQLETGVPVIHEVLLLENRAQAEVRCRGKEHNRGREAAQTAMAMARLMRQILPERPAEGSYAMMTQ